MMNLGFPDDLRLLTVRELYKLIEQNEGALVQAKGKGTRKEYFRRLYAYRLQLLRSELQSRAR